MEDLLYKKLNFSHELIDVISKSPKIESCENVKVMEIDELDVEEFKSTTICVYHGL